MEMALKNAALWIQYSSLSIGRSSRTELLDNGGMAIVPDITNDVPPNTPGQEYGEMTGGWYHKNDGNLSEKE